MPLTPPVDPNNPSPTFALRIELNLTPANTRGNSDVPGWLSYATPNGPLIYNTSICVPRVLVSNSEILAGINSTANDQREKLEQLLAAGNSTRRALTEIFCTGLAVATMLALIVPVDGPIGELTLASITSYICLASGIESSISSTSQAIEDIRNLNNLSDEIGIQTDTYESYTVPLIDCFIPQTPYSRCEIPSESTDDVVIVPPRPYSLSPGDSVPQIALQFAEVNEPGTPRNPPNKFIHIPRPLETDQQLYKDAPPLVGYTQGPAKRQFVLNDNSRIVVNAATDDEAIRVIEAIIPYVNPIFVVGAYFTDPEVGYKGDKGQRVPIDVKQLTLRFARFYSKGTLSDREDWRIIYGF